MIQMGIMAGWASPTVERLKEPGSSVLLNKDQASWVASLLNLGRFFGGILGPVATHYLGSKRSILVTMFPIAIGWLIIMLTDTYVEWLYASRFISGLGVGMTFGSFPLYLGEVSLPQIRGALISLAIVGSPIGQVIASVCGVYLHISTAATAYFGLTILLIWLFFWLPESPYYYVRMKNPERAKKSIKWYRSGKGVEEEYQAIEKFVAQNSSTSFGEKLKALNEPSIRKATLQIVGLFVLMQLSGVNDIMFFMETILKQAQVNTLVSPAIFVIYVNVFCIFASIISIFLIDNCGRRILLMISSTGTSISMAALMYHFFSLDMSVTKAYLQWLPLAAIVLFMASYFVGLMPVPSTILSETLPANMKCIVSSIAMLIGSTFAFLTTKAYEPIVAVLGEAYLFMIFAAFSIVVIPYTLLSIRETKGKSLQEIQDDFMKN
ncbi:hypothetical protein QAD02_018251 [Eretmocerus hayati]|uniref:Uncharacterized protein n=1 Tax=Eretmocerus hayati TaxID=131215 RepID=A0ACC2PIP4_9HYME|nr:hypothetical protein QAD02_018251 [Eretmocerus hayati]